MAEINMSKTDSMEDQVDTNTKVEVLVNNDDCTEQLNTIITEDTDVTLIKGAPHIMHQVEEHEENLSMKPSKDVLDKEDSNTRIKTKGIQHTLEGQGTKFQQHDTKIRDIKATTGASHENEENLSKKLSKDVLDEEDANTLVKTKGMQQTLEGRGTKFQQHDTKIQESDIKATTGASHEREENLSMKPSKYVVDEEDSNTQVKTKGIQQTLKGRGTKFQQHDTKTRVIKATTGVSLAKTLPRIKPSKSCELLEKHFTKPSGRRCATQRPTFNRSRDDIDISVHIYETIPEIQRAKKIFNSHTDVAKFPTRMDPHVSKQTLRAGYKHREPPPDPKKTQSKESIDVQTNSSMTTDCAKSGTSHKYKPPRPPPPKIRLQDFQPKLPPKGQSNIQVCTASNSDSSSTSEDVLTILWSKRAGTGIEISTKVGQATAGASQYGSGTVYQPLTAEGKAPLAHLYESLNTESRSISDDKPDGAGSINDREPSQIQSTKKQPSLGIGKRTDDHPDSDSEDDYMPLVPNRKKNIVVSEYASLHIVRQSQ